MATGKHKLLKVTEHGPFQAQLIELGGAPDEEGMGHAIFRAPPEELRRMSALMFEWVELKATTAEGVDKPEEEPG